MNNPTSQSSQPSPTPPTSELPSTSPFSWWSKLRGTFLVGVGYMLSPLSWWNDLFFNLPIAYGFGLVVSWFRPDWLIPGTVVGYWLSNVLGFVMMQFGASDLLQGDRPKRWKRELLISLGSSTAYTLIVVLLLQFHWLETPTFLTELIP